MAITQLTGYQILDGSVDLAVDVKGVLPMAQGGKHAYALLQDKKSSGTNGGSYGSANTWKKRDINTKAVDNISITLSSNSFLLPAGEYEISVISTYTSDSGENFVLRLYNDSQNSIVSYGMSGVTGGLNTMGFLSTRFSVPSSYYFSIWMMASKTNTRAFALGYPCGFSGIQETYTQISLWKVA